MGHQSAGSHLAGRDARKVGGLGKNIPGSPTAEKEPTTDISL